MGLRTAHRDRLVALQLGHCPGPEPARQSPARQSRVPNLKSATGEACWSLRAPQNATSFGGGIGDFDDFQHLWPTRRAHRHLITTSRPQQGQRDR